MSTHILADVERICDTVGIINRGRLVTKAPQEELIERYAVPAFEVETENGFSEQLKAWAETLHKASWVESVLVDGRTARVVVNDVETAKRELLATAVQSGLILTRYEMVKPSLEDVFMKLVNGEGV
jgi:ABC-2 type transport system ATP-binding protein